MIYGVDPGVRKFALFGIDGARHTADSVEVRRQVRGMELRELRLRLKQLVATSGMGRATIFCEEPVVAGARNLRTTIQIAETVGMVLSIPWPVYLVPVSAWKKETTGHGGINKLGVSDWLRLEYEAYFSSCDGNQDVIDAAAIAVYGTHVVQRTAMDSGSRSPLRGDSD